MMRRLILIITLITGLFFITSLSFAENTATITVTVSLQQVISISLSPTSWEIGSVSLGGSYESPEFTVTNDGNVAEDISIKASNGAGGWSLGPTPGEDTFSLSADVAPYETFDITISTTDTQFISNLPAGGSSTFKLQYSAPTSDTKGGGVSQNFTITLTATTAE